MVEEVKPSKVNFWNEDGTLMQTMNYDDVITICQYCGAELHDLKNYCDKSCRQKAAYDRRKKRLKEQKNAIPSINS